MYTYFPTNKIFSAICVFTSIPASVTKAYRMQSFKQAIFLAILCLPVFATAMAQQKNNALKGLLKAIAHANTYESGYTIGYAGSVSKQYQRFGQLRQLATGRQLAHLAARHKNAVVRLYALQALRQGNMPVGQSLALLFQHDHAMVLVLDGCTGSRRTVHELAEEYLLPVYTPGAW
jgi:hypothetical protein